MTPNINILFAQLVSAFVSLFFGVMFLAVVALFCYMIYQWLKYRHREEYALDFVTLLVRLPRDNEIKIDAAEQMFASFYSVKHDDFFRWLRPEDLFSFEIVALKEDISFHINCPRRIRDLVEKQIHGAYPGAEISEKDEVNIFSEKGRVAFAALQLEKPNYFPIKTYKDLPTDGLSLITSALSKMGEGEGAMLQILLQPIGRRWQEQG